MEDASPFTRKYECSFPVTWLLPAHCGTLLSRSRQTTGVILWIMVGRTRSSFFFSFFSGQFIILSGRFEQGTSNERTNSIPLTDCQVTRRQLLSDYPNWIDRIETQLSDPEVFLIAAARGHESPDLYSPRRGHLLGRMDLMDAAGLTCDRGSAADGLMQKSKWSFAKHIIIV